MADLTDGTGGTFYLHNNDLESGLRKTVNAPDVFYRLAFHPDNSAGGTYHKLKVKIDSRDSVQARRGYFAPEEKSSRESKFDAEVSGSDIIEDLAVQLAAKLGKNSTISVIATVDVSKIRFRKENGRLTQQIRFATALLDSQGAIVAAKEATMDLSLKDATYARLLKSGLNAKLTLQAAPGAYSVREVVEESADHKFSCSTNPVQIP